ncbi:hypothetical protein J5X84_20470 [Streptosporangiaceae bacterium NEAU-GS5]|nr:hypothetical protein [Streptosporangiaceae bacterium NEAU-GS5]
MTRQSGAGPATSTGTPVNGFDPDEVHARGQLRAALAEVRRRSGRSLNEIVERSAGLARRAIAGTGLVPVQLTRSNVSGFTGGNRPQLPSASVLVTFLICCDVQPATLPSWLAALRRAQAVRRPERARPYLPRLPDHFVPRPAEWRRVIAVLEALAARGRGATAALYGTGGFGKTTLALDVCRADRIRELFPDGVVWLEAGQNPVLTTLLADAAARVTGRAPARYGSVDAAAAGLGEALEGRQVLLVLDNVWSPADLEPFLRGGSGCVRLVTCRRVDVLPRDASVVSVERMSPAQALALLAKDVPGASDALLYPLYERSHRWPVVLGILNGVLRARSGRADGMPLATVVSELARRLDERGITGADDLAGVRQRTVREVLEIGVQDLAADPRGDVLRERFLSLGAFPPDQPIGFDALGELWPGDDLDVRAACDRLADRSLLGSVERDGVRLHDVIREHVVAAYRRPIEEWAERLLAVSHAHCPDGRWDLLPDEHAGDLDRLAHLLVFTGGAARLRALLLDLRFMVRRIRQGGIAGLAADLAVWRHAGRPDPVMDALMRLVDLEGHLAMRVGGDAGVAATLWARLSGDPAVRAAVTNAAEALADALVAAGPMPDRPDGRLVRVLSGHRDRVVALSWQPDGARLATGCAGGTVRIWDEAGGALRTIAFEAPITALAWSPDQVHLAVLVGGASVWLVEPIFGDVTARYAAETDLTCLAWTPYALAIGRADGRVTLWDGETATVSSDFGGPAVRAVQWADGAGLVVAHGDGTAVLAVRPASAQAVVAGVESGLALVDLGQAPPAFIAGSGPIGQVTTAGWSHDGAWLAAGLRGGSVALWSVSEGFSAGPRLDYNGQRVAALAWRPLRPQLAVAARADARVFDLGQGPGQVTRFGVTRLRAHPARPLFTAGGTDGRLILLAADRPGTPVMLDAHEEGVRAMAYAPGGERLLTAAWHGPLLLWPVAGLDEAAPRPVPVPSPVAFPSAVAWSPDGALVAIGGDREIAVVDAASFGVVRRFAVSGLVNDLDFDSAGHRLAVAATGPGVAVHSVGGEVTRRLKAHPSGVSAIRWMDGDRLVSAGYDGRVIAWSAEEGSPVGVFGGGSAIRDVAAGTHWIATVTSSGLLTLCSAEPGGPSCAVALDTALSGCAATADGGLLAAAGSAGIALFALPAWVRRSSDTYGTSGSTGRP